MNTRNLNIVRPQRFILTALVTMTMFGLTSMSLAKPNGLYNSPLGTLSITEKNGVVTARQASGKGPCGFKKGKVVFEGSRLDDSITGDVVTCKIGQGCAGEVRGMAMLLIAKKGSIISGAVHVNAGQCKTPLKGDGLRIVKQKKKRTKTKKAAREKAHELEKQTTTRAALNQAGHSDRSSSKVSSDDAEEVHGDETINKEGTRGGSDGSKVGEGAASDGQSGPLDAGPSADATPASPAEARGQAKKRARQGASLLMQGKAEKARSLFQEAVQIDPTYSQGHVGIGITYYQRDRYDEALDAYKKAVEVNPSNPDAYYNMACIYAIQGEKEKALNFLRIALLNGYVNLETIEEDANGDFKNLADDPDFKKLKTGQFY